MIISKTTLSPYVYAWRVDLFCCWSMHHDHTVGIRPHDVAPLELVGLGFSSSMESFASWSLMAAEWRRKKDDWRRHFKEKMSQEEAHHHRKPWIRAWRKEKMSGGRGREGARNFVPQMSYELWSVILKWSELKKCTHMASIYSLSVTQNWRGIWISIKISLEFEIEFVEPNFGAKISLIMISEF